MSKEEQKEVYELLLKYRGTFSHRDDIGLCPTIEVDLKVIDKSLFFIQSLHVKEEDTSIIDERNVKIGTLRDSSSILLSARKNLNFKMIITDFRFLSGRLQRVNLTFHLRRDAFATLGRSKCEGLSRVNLKDVYHIFKLSNSSIPSVAFSLILVQQGMHTKECLRD